VDGPPFITQLCANDQVAASLNSSRSAKTESDSLAEKYHIVTPNCSAVILLDQPLPPNPLLSRRDVNEAQQKSQASTTATGESAKGVSKSADNKNQGKQTLDSSATDPADTANAGNLIPTKPEPPMGLIMFIALLFVLFARLRSTVYKAKC
ncbi:MAG: hypothetical protein K2X81_04925, partial [Candidatus Obscuribacterales bacterium]|nr:hypothetical protein [Candidatus Obscuribacterales bacterium]